MSGGRIVVAALVVFLSSLSRSAPYSFKIECDEPARMRALGEETEFRIWCTDLGATNSHGGTVEVRLDNFGPGLLASRIVDPAKENPIVIKGSLDKPGFLRVVAKNARTSDSKFGIGKGNACFSVGYAPEGLRPGFGRPADFDVYWEGERSRLRREVPIDVRREVLPDDMRRKGFRAWKVSFATFAGKRVWGFLTMPETGNGPWPLRVNVPGAGPALSMRGAQCRDGAVTLSLNVHPYEPAATPEGQQKLYADQDKAMLKKYGTTYATAGVGVSREEYFFHDAILGMDRAVDWAVSLPEVDRSRVWYFGGSQGGGFGMYLMGLNENFTRGYVWICALADLGGYRVGRMSGWPRLVESVKNGNETAERVAPYFDACHFATRVKIPVRMSAGLSDTCCPPTAVWSAYNSLSSADKAIVPCPGVGHNLPSDVRERFEKWLADGGPASARNCDGLEIPQAEFGKYWRMVVGEDPPDGIASFAIDPKVSKTGKDAYRIVSASSGDASDGVSVAIAGSNLRSVLYAVYDLFERRGGCGWFWDGDVVPRRGSIDLSGLDVHEESRFWYRGMRYFAHRGLTRFQAEHWGFDDWKREIDWCVKNRLNLFMLRIGQDDLFQKAFPEMCAYPDASRPLPGAGRAFDNRSLFWPLQFRGELRKKVMDYAFARGMMAPEDFGTMTHWYSRTPQDFLEKAKPDFMPQATNVYGEPSGLVWDIRKPKWMDAYWKITDASVREYGRPDILHTIGVAERKIFPTPEENRRAKADLTNALFDEARRRYPSATRVLAGWDLYCMGKPEEAKSFLRYVPNDIVIWDYEADAYRNTNFTEWDVIGKRPYTFGIFMAYEAGLDPRTDYARIVERQRAIADDPMCVGYLLWPESSHVDSMGIEYFVRNAWRADKPDVNAVVHGYCERRYSGNEVGRMESLWRDTITVSTNLHELWRWNYALPVMRRWTDGPDAKMLNQRDKWSDPRPDAAFSAVPSIFRALREVDWNGGEFLRRDAMDLARTAADRVTVEAENRLMRAWFYWRDGKGGVEAIRAAAGRASRLAHLMARLLALHTDYSLVDSMERLNAVHVVANPHFDRVLMDNCANFYCASHQAEMAEHLYAPAIDAMARQMVEKAERGDRSPLSAAETCRLREKTLDTPLLQMKSSAPRTAEAFRVVLSDLEREVSPSR